MSETTPAKPAADAGLILLNEIPFRVDLAKLFEGIHVEADSEFGEEARQLAREAEALARPKGVYKLAVAEPLDEQTVSLDGVRFTSRVLRVNLDGLYRAFPFVATCGTELEDWSRGVGDPLMNFWAGVIKEMALRAVIEALGRHLATTYEPGERSMMNPGSLEDWPLSQQRPLFSLFGGACSQIGVMLSESFLMSPIKSVSGVWFETQQGFQNCQLCPREQCPNRRAPYDPHLFEAAYRPHGV